MTESRDTAIDNNQPPCPQCGGSGMVSVWEPPPMRGRRECKLCVGTGRSRPIRGDVRRGDQ